MIIEIIDEEQQKSMYKYTFDDKWDEFLRSRWIT